MMKERLRTVLTCVVLAMGLLAGFGCGRTAPTAPPPTPDARPSSAPSQVPVPTPVPTLPLVQATVIDVINDVDADPLAEGTWQDAVADMIIHERGQVWAQEGSTARVGVEEDLIRVAPNTIFTFERPDADTLKLNLDEGQTWINVQGLEEGETLEVETPAAVASVRGTRFSVRVDSSGGTVVSTQAGTVTVSAAAHTVVLTHGLQTVIGPGDPPGVPTSMSPQEQVRWGMAQGADLDAMVPVVGHVGVFTYTGSPMSRSWSPDGRYFAHTYFDPQSLDSGHVFYDVQAGEPVTASLPATASGIFFNPAGGGLAFQVVKGSASYICTTNGLPGGTGVAHTSCFGGDALYGWPYWSPDGRRVLFYSDRRAAASSRRPVGPRFGGALAGRTLHASDLATAGMAFNLFLARPDGSELTQVTFDEEGYDIRQAWSPDGEWFAYVHAEEYNAPGDVRVVKVDGSETRMLFEGIHGDGYAHLAWSPDGTRLAVPAEHKGLWIVGLDGSDAWVIPGTEGQSCWEPAWSPTDDGWPLLFQMVDARENRTAVWGYAPELSDRPWPLTEPGWGAFWAPGGEHVAFGFTVRRGDVVQTDVHFFQAEPAFWP